MASRTINYFGDEKVYNSEKVDELLSAKQDSLTIDTALDTTSTNPVQNKAVATAIDAEETARKAADSKLANDIAAVEAKIGTIDTALDATSSHAVQNKAIKAGIDAETSAREDADKVLQDNITAEETARKTADNEIIELINAETESRTEQDEKLQTQIDAINEIIDPADTEPVKDSKKFVTSGGIFDAIRFASVRVGETMFWPVYDTEEREVISDDTLTFTDASGVARSYTIPEDMRKVKINLCISKDVPDGWHALDGKAELSAEDYPELAAFFGGSNTTTDKKVWLPYVQQKIIKVKY